MPTILVSLQHSSLGLLLLVMEILLNILQHLENLLAGQVLLRYLLTVTFSSLCQFSLGLVLQLLFPGVERFDLTHELLFVVRQSLLSHQDVLLTSLKC